MKGNKITPIYMQMHRDLMIHIFSVTLFFQFFIGLKLNKLSVAQKVPD